MFYEVFAMGKIRFKEKEKKEVDDGRADLAVLNVLRRSSRNAFNCTTSADTEY